MRVVRKSSTTRRLRSGGRSHGADEPDHAQIAIEGVDHQYEAIRIENTLTDKSGNEVQLKPGAEVEVTIKAAPEAIRFRS